MIKSIVLRLREKQPLTSRAAWADVRGRTSHYYLPDVRAFRLNKYGMPSYSQLNASLSYPFRGWAKGLRGQLLYLYKASLGDTYGEARYVVNKVDMHQLNLIVNYDF
ncbi:hypothetical protein SAMN00120144_0242 [Hymenobacter roseosalivarius DSM 11622]|uniref:Uncharacterized protein n=1 Tax=Hymenobacter roseosalivarius DSM 11622 TaxID=645990 RepID=A0A1W1W1M7_9BACT|nr:hypothetical protein [Hymenobacter roseosalivarius]SMB99527.1 hypothetical protein SAMN00120144_0242 [Hymenobacter roseosalivarius DSM 11622]